MKTIVKTAILLPLFFLSACQVLPSVFVGKTIEGVRHIEVSSWQWGYKPSFINAHPGERIRMKIVSLDVAHTLTNEDLGINIPIPARGATPVDFEFTVPSSGDFIFHCEASCGPARSRQKMRLIVVKS